ncbi:MAG: peptidoglycan-binding protein [Iphinoe sp. HA4291-MV1]|jgi:peptidoglycan hydrolase-like protein with peptidoglycan-binding domain|nr:peptidoglycan-binding protein [Iphinoe sp. HA4291-MV1]
MKGSMKTSILSYLGFLNPSVNCRGIKSEQRYKSLFGIEILLYCGASVLLSFWATASVAVQPQYVAQVNSSEGINRPTLRVGSKGERVTELQAALKLLGFYTDTVDGVYNESTAQAVSRFQQAAGLKANGVVDATTWQRLFPGEPIVASSGSSPNSTSRFPVPSGTSNTNKVVPTSDSRTVISTTNNTTAASSKPEPRPTTTRNTTANSQRTYVRQSTSTRSDSTRSEQTTRIQQSDRSGSTRSEQTTRTQQSSRPSSTTRTQKISSIQYTPKGLPILRLGMSGSEVVKLQKGLQRLGFLKADKVDGDFGATTEAAVIALQKRYGLDADGVVGGETWEILTKR